MRDSTCEHKKQTPDIIRIDIFLMSATTLFRTVSAKELYVPALEHISVVNYEV